MSRSFTKKGFVVTPGPRDPLGYFEDSVKIQNGSLLLFRMPSQIENEDSLILEEFGAVMREMVFTTNSLKGITSSLYGDSLSLETTITFETEPTRIIITQDTSYIIDTAAYHPNRVHRIDWVLLSASSDVEATIKKIFEVTSSKKMHGGCCDFWRIGTIFDPTFLRFEPAKKKAKDSRFFTVEEGNFYFAY
ncbi:MAG TPA: hypothetical protein VIX80_06835 [Candidatus Kapabacteria bacterium]